MLRIGSSISRVILYLKKKNICCDGTKIVCNAFMDQLKRFRIKSIIQRASSNCQQFIYNRTYTWSRIFVSIKVQNPVLFFLSIENLPDYELPSFSLKLRKILNPFKYTLTENLRKYALEISISRVFILR